MSNGTNGCASVLLVEDEEPIRKLMTRIFERAGYEVTSFASPVEALELPGSGAPMPDLLVVDLGLPSMAGDEFADRFTRQHPAAKVLFTSGALDASVAAASAPEGRDFVQKPFGRAELLEKAASLLPA